MEENNLENDAQTVGEIIRNARLKQGKTVSDASQELCIRKTYVEAIENMELSKMPQMPYALGFVRSYADYLGLNSNRIVFLYRKAIMGDTVEEDEVPSHTETSVPGLKHILLAVVGLLIGFVIWTSWPAITNLVKSEENNLQEETVIPEPEIIDADQISAEENTQDNFAATEDEQRKEADESAQKEENSAEQEKESATEENVAENTKKVKFVLTGPSWIELKEGDKVLLNGIYRKGFEYELELGKGQIITIGRHYNVRFYVDGKQTKVVSAIRSRDVKIDEVIK